MQPTVAPLTSAPADAPCAHQVPPLRVLHLCYQYLALTENWVFRLIDHLPDTEVLVAAQTFIPNHFYSPRLRFIQFPLREAEAFGAHLPAGAWLFNRGVRWSRRFYWRYVAAVAGPLDLMHSHFSFVGWEYLRLARRLRVPHVVSFYGVDYEALPRQQPVWRSRYHQLFAEADLFICEGPHGASRLAAAGCPAHKLRVVPLGIEPAAVPRRQQAKPAGSLRLIQVASFGEKKGHIDTVRAFLRARASCPELRLSLAGPDIDGRRGALQDLIRAEKAEDAVRFLDAIDFARLHSLLAEHDVFIHPSCEAVDGDCEGGAPIVLLDAQAVGLPVIATRHCDIPEEVRDGVTGLLSDEHDWLDLSRAIERFYHMSDDEYRGFSAAAHRHVATHYDAAHNARRLRQVYRELLGARPVPAAVPAFARWR